MAHLVKIGNSQGIRISKTLIQLAYLEGRELDIQLLEEGVLVSPVNKPRYGWQEAIKEMLLHEGDEAAD